tara:strand:- start:192 stop:395 length:204 start_codon:yes stop_codon:yes gene_type:complete
MFIFIVMLNPRYKKSREHFMELSAKEIQSLRELHNFMLTSFKGASVGSFQVNDGTAALAKVLKQVDK